MHIARIALITSLACLAAASLRGQQPPAPEPAPAAPAAAEAVPAAAGTMEYFQLDSKLLERKVEVGVYLPAGYAEGKQRYPTLYFLHGMNGSARKWQERGTDKTLDQLIAEQKVVPTLVVCPNGMDSMYVNALENNAPWGDFVATELVKAIDGKYRTVADRALRGINGDSMGGYGALNAAFKHPEVFGSVSAHSAAIYPIDPAKLPDGIKRFAPHWKPVYGWPIDEKHWQEWNPLALAEEVPAESLKKVAIYFDCGDRDRYGFDKTSAELHEILEKRGVAHEWTLRSGGHGRDYFSDSVPFAFLFHNAVFAAAAKDAPQR